MTDDVGRFYGRDGKRLTFEEWGSYRERWDYRRIGSDEINATTVLFTTWIGMNLALAADPPLIFETMLFRGQEGELIDRYPTEEEAQEGHRKALSELLVQEMGQALLDGNGERVDVLVPRLQALGLDL